MRCRGRPLLLVTIERSIRVSIAVLTSRIIVAVDIAIRISFAVEIAGIAVHVRPIISTAPLCSEYPKIFLLLNSFYNFFLFFNFLIFLKNN